MFPVNVTKFLRTLFWRTSENGCFEFNMYYINIRLKRQFISKLSITLLTNYRNIWSKYFVYTHTTFLWRVAAYFIRRYVHKMYLLSQNYQGYRTNILFLVFNDAKETVYSWTDNWNENLQKHSPRGVLYEMLRLATSLKKRLWRRCFSLNFAKFLRKPFLQNTCEMIK